MSRRPDWVPWALGVGTALLYAACLGNGFTNWDDPDYVLHNAIAGQGLKGVFTAFATPFDGAYYPLTQACYAVLHALAGPDPLAHHLFQVVLFAACVALVPSALAAFGVPRAAGIAAAVLWAVHPLRVESVAWAANLKDAVGALGVVAAFALYGAHRRAPAVLAFAAGLLGKSMFFPLALLFPAVDLLRGAGAWAALKRTWPFLVAGGVVALVAGLLHVTGPQAEHWAPRTAGQVLGTAAWTPWWYLGRILWPQGPRAVYDFAQVALLDARVGVALALWAALGIGFWRAPARLRLGMAVATAAYLLPLLPVGGLIPTVQPVADRYTLFPSLALFGGLAFLAASRLPVKALAGGTAVAALAMAPFNVLRQREWAGSVPLWESNLRAAPGAWLVHINLSNAYGEAARWEDAVRELEAALRPHPERRGPLGTLFHFCAARDGIPPEDLERLRGRLEADLDGAEAWTKVGEWCVVHDHPRTARCVLEHVPGLSSQGYALRLLSVVDRKEGRFQEAVTHAQAAVQLGQPKARIEWAYALADLGRYDEALALAEFHFEEPYTAALLEGARAYALVKMGRLEEGQAAAREAMRIVQEQGTPPAQP